MWFNMVPSLHLYSTPGFNFAPAKRTQQLFAPLDQRSGENVSLQNLAPCLTSSIIFVSPVLEFGSTLCELSQRNMTLSRTRSRMPESTHFAFHIMHRRVMQPSSLTVSFWSLIKHHLHIEFPHLVCHGLPMIARMDASPPDLIRTWLEPELKTHAAKRAATNSWTPFSEHANANTFPRLESFAKRIGSLPLTTPPVSSNAETAATCSTA